ncbi:kinase-like domain-containing protein [Xylariales sp. PMI_506]|nr:kinase-like domain-containing protein [Xylariales sp. PMI_506]
MTDHNDSFGTATNPFSIEGRDDPVAEPAGSRQELGAQSPHPRHVCGSEEDLDATTQATNAFSESFLEQRMQDIRQAASQSKIRIHHLDASELQCRILIQPVDIEAFKAQGGDHVHLYPRQEFHDRYSDDAAPAAGPTRVDCIAIDQSRGEVYCQIETPFHCRLYYDPWDDAVHVRNTGHLPIYVVGIQTSHEEPGEKLMIEPRRHLAITPGPWSFLDMHGSCVCQTLVFRRNCSLTLILPTPLLLPAGSKRRRSDSSESGRDRKHGDDDDRIAHEQSAHPRDASDDRLMRPITSLTQVGDGHRVSVATAGKEDYRLLRIEKTGDSRSCTVFNATMSTQPNKLVVVKALREDAGRDAIVRGDLWLREYMIHRELNIDVIAQLLDGDARIYSLIIERIDAKDLGHRSWQDENYFFTGTRRDAGRVLVDMARALHHLRQKRILHNDIKPRNILYRRETGAVLIDFGLGTHDGGSPAAGGTPWYVAPEYLRERRGAPAEIWALGVTMLYLLRRTAHAESQNRGWLIRDVTNARVQRPRALFRSWLGTIAEAVADLEQVAGDDEDDDGLEELVCRMLDVDDEERIDAESLLQLAELIR